MSQCGHNNELALLYHVIASCKRPMRITYSHLLHGLFSPHELLMNLTEVLFKDVVSVYQAYPSDNRLTVTLTTRKYLVHVGWI